MPFNAMPCHAIFLHSVLLPDVIKLYTNNNVMNSNYDNVPIRASYLIDQPIDSFRLCFCIAS